MSVSEVLGTRLREIRKGKGLTQDEMASALGCARMSYVHYENAKRTPDIDFLAKVSNLTGYSTDFLLGKVESSIPDNEAIHRQLGISEAAIEGLRILSSMQDYEKIYTLNYLITTDYGLHALHLLSVYRRAAGDDD